MDGDDRDLLNQGVNFKNEARVYQLKFFRFISFLQGEMEDGKVLKGSGNIHLLVILFDSFQIMSMMFVTESSVKDWEKYSVLWDALRYTRLDYIAFRYGFAIYIFAMVSLFHILLILLYIYIFTKFSENEKIQVPWTISLVKAPFHLISRYLHFPLLLIAVAYTKYTNTEEITIEYGVAIFKLSGTFLLFWIICYILFLQSISIVKEYLMSESAHSMLNTHSDAKITGKYDLIRLLWKSLQVLLYFYILPFSKYMYFIATFSLSLTVSIFFYSRLPYYKKIFNVVIVISLWFTAFSSLAFFIGTYQDNATLIFLLHIIMLPFISLLALFFVNKKFEALKSLSPFQISTYWQLEITLRDQFVSKKISENMLAKKEFRNKCNAYCQILDVIDSYYLFMASDKPELARSLLSTSKDYPGGIEWEYQAYRCNKILSSNFESQCFRYLFMLKKEKENKDLDLLACKQFYILCKLLYHGKKNLNSISKTIKEITPTLKNLNRNYKHLIKQYPNSSGLIRNYGTFLVTFSDKSEFGRNLITKVDNKTINYPQNGNGLTPFKEYSGNILISCNEKSSYLKVVQSNDLAVSFLSYEAGGVLGVSLEKLLPLPGSLLTEKIFDFFDQFYKDLPTSYYLMNSEGLLIPVYIKIYFDSIDFHQHMLISFVQNKRFVGEAAISDNNGLILGHTAQFNTLIGYSENLKGKLIIDLLPDHSEIISRFYRLLYYDADIYLFSIPVILKSETISVILALKGNKELDFWQALYSAEIDKDDEFCCAFENDDEVFEDFLYKYEPPENSEKIVKAEKKFFSFMTKSRENQSINDNDYYFLYDGKIAEAKKVIRNVKIVVIGIVMILFTASAFFLFLSERNLKSFVEFNSQELKIGFVSQDLLEVGQVARLIWLASKSQFMFDYIARLTESKGKIVNIQHSLEAFSSQHAYFKEIYSAENIAIQTVEGIEKFNFFDLISFYLRTINDVIGKSPPLETDLFILYENSFGRCAEEMNSKDFIQSVDSKNEINLVWYLIIVSSFMILILFTLRHYLKIMIGITRFTFKPVLKMNDEILLSIYNEVLLRFDIVHNKAFSNLTIPIYAREVHKRTIYKNKFGYFSIGLILILLSVLITSTVILNNGDMLNIKGKMEKLGNLYQSEAGNILKIWEFSMEKSLIKTPLNYTYISNFTIELEKSNDRVLKNNHIITALIGNINGNNSECLLESCNSLYPSLHKGLLTGISEFAYTQLDSSSSIFDEILRNKFTSSFALLNEINSIWFNIIYSTSVLFTKEIKTYFNDLLIIISVISVVVAVYLIVFIFYLRSFYKQVLLTLDFMKFLDLLNSSRKQSKMSTLQNLVKFN